VVSVHDIKRIGSDVAEAAIDIYHHGRWAIYETVVIELSSGKWQISKVLESRQA
jgi:hypothetical protein